MKYLPQVVHNLIPLKESVPDTRIYGLTMNSNDVNEGDIFIAIDGKKADGHDFIHQAVDRGSSAIISNKCLGCHAKGNSLFIPPLETYNEVKSYANLDSIINGLTDTPMPPESAMQLTDCEKLQIESWVTNEFPEYE